jgi:hypothetical protein
MESQQKASLEKVSQIDLHGHMPLKYRRKSNSIRTENLQFNTEITKAHQLTSLSSKIQQSRNPKKLPTLYITNPHHFQWWKNFKMHSKVNFPKYNNSEWANRYPKQGK